MLLSQREWADELDDDKWYPTYMGVGAGVSSGTYLMLGNRSDTIPLKSFKSSTKNLGTFTSLMARNTISSCQEKHIVLPLNLINFWGLWLFLYRFQKRGFFLVYLVHVGVLSLEVTGGGDDRLYSSHTKVIMILTIEHSTLVNTHKVII